MSAVIPQTRKPSKKLQQFLDELNVLCDKYQYQLAPSLNYTQDGILPNFKVVDVPPKKTRAKRAKKKS